MNENFIHAEYDLSKKSRIKRFYESNKILIYSFIFLIILAISGYSYFLHKKEKNKILLSENYVQAKIYLSKGNQNQALDLLKEIVFSNDVTYSTLSFFLILNADLIKDHKEISKLFDHLLENNNYEDEIKNLFEYKKALYLSNYLDEAELLKETKHLINKKESIWKAYTLILLGDFYVSKKEYIKAKDFYMQVLSLKNLEKDIYEQTKSQLALISDD